MTKIEETENVFFALGTALKAEGFKAIRFYRDKLRMILAIGLPAGIQSNMYTLANMFLQSSINSFGTVAVASWTAFGKVDGFYWMISGA